MYRLLQDTNRSLFLSLPPLIIVVLSPLLRISCSLLSSFLASAYQSCCVYLPPVCATNMFRAWMDPELADHNCWSAARRSNRAVAAGCLFALNPHPPPLSLSLSLCLSPLPSPPSSLLFSLSCVSVWCFRPSVRSFIRLSFRRSVDSLVLPSKFLHSVGFAHSPVHQFRQSVDSLLLPSIISSFRRFRSFSIPSISSVRRFAHSPVHQFRRSFRLFVSSVINFLSPSGRSFLRPPLSSVRRFARSSVHIFRQSVGFFVPSVHRFRQSVRLLGSSVHQFRQSVCSLVHPSTTFVSPSLCSLIHPSISFHLFAHSSVHQFR